MARLPKPVGRKSLCFCVRRSKMHSLPMLGAFLEWPQYVAIAALVGLIIFYVQYKKRNM